MDVFFVISGYLITGLMSADLERGTFLLGGFWERRIRRIWPAALLVTLTVLITGFMLMLPSDYVNRGRDPLAQLGMVANVRFWLSDLHNYFAPATSLMPLLHTWSLAVEEQFYLVFPVMLAFFWRLGRRGGLAVLGVLAVASFVASVLWIKPSPHAVFYLLPFRAWELLVGALLALWDWPAPKGRWVRETIALTGMGFILWPCWAYTSNTVFPGLAALPPCLGAVLLIFMGSPCGGFGSLDSP